MIGNVGTFRAYRIFEGNNKSVGRFVELTLDDLDQASVGWTSLTCPRGQ